MSIENIVQTVMTSKKYSNIIPETINRICNEESIKYKKDKDILRSSKKPANKSQVLFSRFLKLFVNLFLCTIRRPALYPAYTKS